MGDSAKSSEIGQMNSGRSVYNGDPHHFMRQEASKYERLKKYLDRVGLRITLLLLNRRAPQITSSTKQYII